MASPRKLPKARAVFLQNVDAHIQPGGRSCAMLSARLPETCRPPESRGGHQPVGQVVAVALHQVSGVDGVALVKTSSFRLSQRTLKKSRRPRSPGWPGAARRARTRGHGEIEQGFAQHGVHRFCQVARARAVLFRSCREKKPGHHGVGRCSNVSQPHQLGTGVRTGMHPRLSPLWPQTRPPSPPTTRALAFAKSKGPFSLKTPARTPAADPAAWAIHPPAAPAQAGSPGVRSSRRHGSYFSLHRHARRLHGSNR